MELDKSKIEEIRADCADRAKERDWSFDSLGAENIAHDALSEVFGGSCVSYTPGSNRFPDIVIDNIGFEIKCSNSRKILGNSVLQENPGVGMIYSIWFISGEQRVHVCKYSDLIESIKVDHNPRFLLSVDGGNKISEFLGESLENYFKLGKEDKHKKLKDYLKNHTTIEDWKWFMSERDESVSEEMVAAIFSAFEDGRWKNQNKNDIRVYVFSHYIKMLADEQPWGAFYPIVYDKFKVLGPVKDTFTAGGGNGLPAILRRFNSLIPRIEDEVKRNSKAQQEEWKKHAIRFVQVKFDGSPGLNKKIQLRNQLLDRIRAI